MRRCLILILLLTSLISFAQTQQGIVKTRGRMTATGTVIPGTLLSGATVNVRNVSTLVTGNNGSFLFVVPSKIFYLTGVKKQGYILCDNDILGRGYRYSADPFVVVMETPDNTMADRLAAERKIRLILRRQVQEKEDEIETMKAQQKITEEEYNMQLQDLYTSQGNNEKLISEMADRYSTIDFDAMDDFQRQVAFFIQNGELTRADSLLNTKGSMDDRSAELDRMDAAIKADAEDLAKRQVVHAESLKMKAKALEDFATDCYSRFEICKMLHKNDSAAYWLELRASKDTTNGSWQIECGSFILNYLADYTLAQTYMERVVYLFDNDPEYSDNARGASLVNLADVYFKNEKYDDAIRLYTEVRNTCKKDSITYICATIGLADCYNVIEENNNALKYNLEADSLYTQFDYNIPSIRHRIYDQLGECLCQLGEFQQALKYINLAVNIVEQEESLNDINKIITYNLLAYTYKKTNMFKNAEEYYKKALELAQLIFDDKHPTLATIYNNLGALYYIQNRFEDAFDYLMKAKDADTDRKNTEHYAQTCSNIAAVYSAIGNSALEEQYETEAYNTRLRIFGEDSTAMIKEYNSLGALYYNKRDYKTAKFYLEKALSIRKKESGGMHPSLFSANSYLGGICMQLGDFEESLVWFQQNLEIAKRYYGEEDPRIALTYNNIGGVYLYLKKYDDAVAYINKSLRIHLSTYGENHADVASDYNGLAQTYMAMGHYGEAITNFNKAIDIRKIVFGSNSIKLKSLYEFLREIYQKLDKNEEVKYYDTLLAELQE